MLILDKIAEHVDYCQIFRKVSILVKIRKYFDFGKQFPKFSKICKDVDFGKKFPKISILVKIFVNIDFGENCRKISNLDNFLEKSRF